MHDYRTHAIWPGQRQIVWDRQQHWQQRDDDHQQATRHSERSWDKTPIDG